jgi:hypothetical protein
VVASLPLNNDMARLASASIFCNRFPTHPFTEELRKVAELLM